MTRPEDWKGAEELHTGMEFEGEVGRLRNVYFFGHYDSRGGATMIVAKNVLVAARHYAKAFDFSTDPEDAHVDLAISELMSADWPACTVTYVGDDLTKYVGSDLLNTDEDDRRWLMARVLRRGRWTGEVVAWRHPVDLLIDDDEDMTPEEATATWEEREAARDARRVASAPKMLGVAEYKFRQETVDGKHYFGYDTDTKALRTDDLSAYSLEIWDMGEDAFGCIFEDLTVDSGEA